MVGDKTLKCLECGQEFVWTHGEQQFYQEKSLSQPKFCQICRGKRKAREEFEKQWSGSS